MLNEPLILPADHLEQALSRYRVWDTDQRTLGLDGQVSLQAALTDRGLRWQVQVSADLARLGFDALSGW
ncbi:hypothetical protein [Candidatus Cyanaurora vandensis]|uniref:hypothetical protein n=1 Tax=Candidatus Cyanaurora vandensis TaxID=2714958 RepID=UPI0025796B64|nr:hypothetical protein [Candidatus Cyanaurora vandensis]